jgi:uncharacterized protein (TIGR02246 family)
MDHARHHASDIAIRLVRMAAFYNAQDPAGAVRSGPVLAGVSGETLGSKGTLVTHRPTLAIVNSDAEAAVAAFASGLQAGHDQRDAQVLNRQFAADIIWGSPFGALIEGYDQLHPIHVRFQQKPKSRPDFRYRVRHMVAVTDDVVIAHIARLALAPDGNPLPPSAAPEQPFSEMAMYVLVRKDGQWWLAAGQNTPMRPGGAAPAITSG